MISNDKNLNCNCFCLNMSDAITPDLSTSTLSFRKRNEKRELKNLITRTPDVLFFHDKEIIFYHLHI